MELIFHTKNDLRCSRCGSREVVIVRRYSGEVLCRKCLKESLLSRIRRSISKYGLLVRDDEIIFLNTGTDRDEILWILLSEVESEFPTSITEKRINSSDLWNGIIEHLKRNPIQGRKVVVPLILDDVVGLLLRFIFTGSPRLLVIRGRILLALEVIYNYVSPFVEIPVEELFALKEGSIDEELASFRSPNPYLKLVEDLERENPGMRFNILRMIERDDMLRSMGIVFR